MTEFTIETPALRRALTTALAFVADDTLPSLNVVHISSSGESAIEVAATDRYVLSVETLAVDGEPFELSIPQNVAKQIVTLLPRPRRNTLIDSLTTVTKDGEKVTVRLVGDVETAITFTPIDESEPSQKFVNYRELIAKIEDTAGQPAELMGFNPRFLGKVCKVFADRMGHTEPMKVRFRGHSKAVTVEPAESDGLKVVVMPTRITEYEKQQDAKTAEVAA